MTTRRYPVTGEELAHPSVRCLLCGGRGGDLERVSVKTMHVDDFHYECRGFCAEDTTPPASPAKEPRP